MNYDNMTPEESQKADRMHKPGFFKKILTMDNQLLKTAARIVVINNNQEKNNVAQTVFADAGKNISTIYYENPSQFKTELNKAGLL